MKNNDEFRGSFDDLLFENRNHEYGAYVIRKSYHDNVNKAALVAIGAATVVAILSILPREMTQDIIPATPGDRIVLKEVPHIQLKVRPLPPPSQPVRANANLASVAVTHEPTIVDLPPNEPTAGSTEGSVEGDPFAGVIDHGIPDEIGPSIPAVEPPKVFLVAEVMPSFVGGDEAMYKFIVKKTRYPSRARRIEQQGTVYVEFIVGRDGNIIQPKVLKGFNADCDEEALRVISTMPIWNPGKQGGVPVMVRMVMPVKFKLG